MNKFSRRPFIKKMAGAAAATGLLATQTACGANGSNEMKGDFVHMVFFWLKTPESTELRKAFLQYLRTFINAIDNIKEKHIGIPAGTFRDVVDSSYHYSLVVTFRNKAEHDAYQKHPAHEQFRQDTNRLIDRVQIYDSVRLEQVAEDIPDEP